MGIEGLCGNGGHQMTGNGCEEVLELNWEVYGGYGTSGMGIEGLGWMRKA